ncbi:DUF2306 domain-containing protein [Cognatishimia sp. SS12]|uniref:DUF2306 domain-containing protein n=1 Tax=Cognatishimia sp. SS12 TaxID=2979465 RepID=UPI0023313575|nr:DUF2306 domain-containing protein [Cognatishimia sp. SS12]MDC0738818.1 DUF2306 domain-containing protein [Cognatishimia sp. SS12]
MPNFTARRLLPRSLPLLWFLSIAIALGSFRFLVADMALVMPDMVHHALAQPWSLYLHIAVAPLLLLLLPLQFNAKLRQQRPVLHRWAGRLYALLILVSGSAALALAPQVSAGPVAGLGFGLLALVWIAVTAVAVWQAMQGRIAAHRRWMIRSAALTLAAVSLRVFLLLGVPIFGFEATYVAVSWLSWVGNLLIAEWLLHRQRLPLGTKKPA